MRQAILGCFRSLIILTGIAQYDVHIILFTPNPTHAEMKM